MKMFGINHDLVFYEMDGKHYAQAFIGLRLFGKFFQLWTVRDEMKRRWFDDDAP